jgi:hypothetical protein
MSIYISSSDLESGTTSNGVWNVNRTLNGQYNILSQHFSVQNIPWMWNGTNNLKINFPDDELNHTKIVSLDYSLCDTINYSSIAALWDTNIQDKLDEIKTETTGAVDVTVNVTYSNGNFSFVFTGVPEIVQFLFGDPTCTCSQVFNKTTTIGHVNTITIANTFMTIDPKYLEVYITESVTQYATSHSTSPTILFSTQDSEFTGQSFTIRRNATQLTIKIYRENVTISTVPLSNDWSLILTQ